MFVRFHGVSSKKHFYAVTTENSCASDDSEDVEFVRVESDFRKTFKRRLASISNMCMGHT